MMMNRSALEEEDDCSSLFEDSDCEGVEQLQPQLKGSRHLKKDSLGLDIFFSRIDVNQMPSFHNSATDINGNSTTKATTAEDPNDERHDREWERWAKRKFAEASKAESIVLDEEGNVLAATLWRLVSMVSLGMDSEMMEDFFMTFRVFVEAEEMARLMGLRLRMAFEVESEGSQTARLKCFLALRHWIQNYFEVDFSTGKAKGILQKALNRIWEETLIFSMTDKQMLMNLDKFLNVKNDEAEAEVAEASDQLSELNMQLSGTKKKKAGWMSKLFKRVPKETPAFLRVASPSFSSLDEDKASMQSSIVTQQQQDDGESFDCFLLERSEDLATQLCLLESAVFNSISWSDLLLLCTSKPQSIQKAVAHFNTMCNWFVEQLTEGGQTLINLTSKLEKMIKVGYKCIKYGNFASAVQIALALQNGQVQRMLEAWERISLGSRSMLKDLFAFACPLKNWRTVRQAMESFEADEEPCVPFLGLFMSDINAVNEIPSAYGDMIPWFKCVKLAKIIRQFQTLKKGTVDPRKAYEFKKRPELFAYLSNIAST